VAGGAVAVAGLASFMAFFLHGMTDWLWEFPALSILGLGALTVGARVRSEPPAVVASRDPWGPPIARRRVVAIAGAALTIAAAISLALPGAAARVERSAYKIQRDDPGGALARLLRAGDLNPLSADPLLARAVLARRLGQQDVATEAMAEAVRRESRNWLMQFEAGLFAAQAGRHADAVRALDEASRLNPGQPVIEDARAKIRRGEDVDPDEAERALSAQLQQKLRPVDAK
jgi:tetratricopeptide (TPR) repeat protein